VENALSRREVQALLVELQGATHLDTSMVRAGELMIHQSRADATVRRWPFPYHFGPSFRALIDNPRITPLLQGRLGQEVKLNHEYVQTLRSRPTGGSAGLPSYSGGIHGGPPHLRASADGSAGEASTDEVLTVVYELLDVSAEDGGFGAVTGSHHAQHPLPISRQVHIRDA
jgi:hypothetical protein